MLGIIKVVLGFLVFLGLLIAVIFLSAYSLNLALIFLALIGIVAMTITIRKFLIYKGLIAPNKKYTKNIHRAQFDDEFKTMYNDLHSKYSIELESTRKILKRIVLISIMFFIISSIAFLVIITTLNIRDNSGQRVIFIITFLPSLCYFSSNYYKHIKIYKDKFKESIISNFVKLINPNLQYIADGNDKMMHYYKNANFNDRYYEKFNCDDYIGGCIDNEVVIEVSDVCLQVLGKGSSVEDTPFMGVFSYSSFNNTIEKEVRIKKNKLNFLDSVRKVAMDSEEFKKYFDVFCDSNILAMQILTHDVMEEIVNFYLLYKLEFEIVILENNIYIRFQTGSMFEPKIFSKSTNMNTLWIYYSILKFTISFTSKVNRLVKDIEV